jgi:dolichol-phosphate mannosyltransferase
VNGDLSVHSDVGVLLPTYREAENIGRLIDEIESLPLSASILVVDDSSPDGTGEIVREMQKKRRNLLLCCRPTKGGLGTALRDGFQIFLSLDSSPRYVVTMDADYSHSPKALLRLVSEMQGNCAIVVGSRYCKGGETTGWPFTRKFVSRVANSLARFALGLKLKDCTSGFRCYSTNFLRSVIKHLCSQSYEIQIEILKKALSNGFEMRETPISFTNRKIGRSKLSSAEFWRYLSFSLKLGVARSPVRLFSFSTNASSKSGYGARRKTAKSPSV